MGNPKIYLGQDGQYHDDTDANRELYPSAEHAAERALEEAVPDGEPVPFTDDGKMDGELLVGDGTGQALPDAPNQTGDTELVVERGLEVQTEGSGTVVESGSDVPPVTAEPDAPAKATAKTRKQ